MTLDQRDRFLLYGAAFLRNLCTGMSGVSLGLYLAATGAGSAQIGLLVAAGLAGGAVATLGVSLGAERMGRRRTLLLLSALFVLGGAGLAIGTGFPTLLAASFFGMVCGMGRDRGAAFTLEQAILPQTAPERSRTEIFAWYNVVLALGNAGGSLLAGLPHLLRAQRGMETVASYRWGFGLYTLLALVASLMYLGLSRHLAPAARETDLRIRPGTKRIVAKFSVISGLDSLGGGFLPDALLSYWFFRRFGVTESFLAPLFLGTYVMNVISYPASAWIARKVGLINTMVWTHLPSHLLLMALPFAPNVWTAAALCLARAFLVEMDVPARQSYVTAVVSPEERAFASGAVNLTRTSTWAVGPFLAGQAMQSVSLSVPMFVGGTLKAVYDLLLWRAFRYVRPPEET